MGEFEERFGSEAACRAYLVKLRWPDGFLCPSCGGRRAWPIGRGDLMECSGCHRQTSITAGTIFEGTRKPLRMWFRAMWWVTSQKTGVSALGLQRVLGLGSYQTAWAWLHKLRRAMVRPGRERLSGRVEVDETYVGGHERERGGGVRGRGTTRKSLVAIAAEEDGTGIGRIRMQRINGADRANLERFIAATVEPGSVIHTDGWRGSRRSATHIRSPDSTGPMTLLMNLCRESTGLRRYSSAGCWEPIKVPSAMNISSTTSTNSRSDSTVEDLKAAESSSTVSCSKLSQWNPSPTIASSAGPENHNLLGVPERNRYPLR